MNLLEKEFATTRILISAIYGSAVIYAGMIYFHIPPVAYRWEQTYEIMFFALLTAIPAMFFATALIGKQLLGPEKLGDKFHSAADTERGFATALAQLRTGMIVMAAIGEACALYGLALYLLSGDTLRPFIFIAASGVHYLMTVSKLKTARADIERLSRNV